MRYIALVDTTSVVGIAVAGDPPDAAWLAYAQAHYAAVVDVTDLDPRPAIGWTYDAATGDFTPPPMPEPDPPAPEP